jgi:hypothetical protein
MALFYASAEAAMDNGEDEMAEFYAAAAAAVNEASLPSSGSSIADYGFADNVGPADFQAIEEEETEGDDFDADELGSSRLSARRVAGIMSPTNEFEQSRLHAGRRAAEVMSPPGVGDDETMALFYQAAESAAVSGDGEMAYFYAAAAAAATITGGAKADAYFNSLEDSHVDDATEGEYEPVRTSRLGQRQVAGADDTKGNLLTKRREAETLGVSGLHRKNVDTGPAPVDITAADMAGLMAQQIAQNTTVEMIELAQQMALSTLGQQAEDGARKSPLSPHQSPRSPGRKNPHQSPRSRRKSGGQENMTSPKSVRKSFENFQPSSPKGVRKSFDLTKSPVNGGIVEQASRNSFTSPRKERRRSSIDPTGGIASPPIAEKLNILPGGHLMHDVTV